MKKVRKLTKSNLSSQLIKLRSRQTLKTRIKNDGVHIIQARWDGGCAGTGGVIYSAGYLTGIPISLRVELMEAKDKIKMKEETIVRLNNVCDHLIEKNVRLEKEIEALKGTLKHNHHQVEMLEEFQLYIAGYLNNKNTESIIVEDLETIINSLNCSLHEKTVQLEDFNNTDDLKAWIRVWNLCNVLGMEQTGMTSVDLVCTYIKKLARNQK